MSQKANVFDIQRSSFYDGPGIRTTIFLKGCPLKCQWCHNPESHATEQQLFYYYDKCIQCAACENVCENTVHQIINGTHAVKFTNCELCGKCVEACNSSALTIMGTQMSVDEVMAIIVTDSEFYKNSNGGITLSGGEPLLHLPFALELLKKCKEIGINTCVETSGFVPSEKFRQILPLVDILLFDYKITGTEEHKKYTGVENELILANLDIAYKYGTSIILRCPVIEGINDTQEHFKGIRDLDMKYPNLMGIELLPYHAIGNNKRSSIGIETTLSEIKTTTPEMAADWIGELKKMNCTKVKNGWD